MERSSITLTVLFDAPFWMGVFERVENGQLTVAKITFGAEPKDYEVHDFVLKHFCNLKFSPAVVAEERTTQGGRVTYLASARRPGYLPALAHLARCTLRFYLCGRCL